MTRTVSAGIAARRTDEAESVILGQPIASVANPITNAYEMLRQTETKPLFMTLDREKVAYISRIFDLGHRMNLEIEKPDIIPKEVYNRLHEICNGDDMRAMKLINERLLDMRVVANIGDDLDQTVKKAVLKFPHLRNGLAILNGHNYAFTECDNYGGVARDIKQALKKVNAANGTVGLGSTMPAYLPIPFEECKLDYGTWGRPAVIDENVSAPVLNLSLSLLEVHTVRRFKVNDKNRGNEWTSDRATDITANVQGIVSGSGLNEGFAVVTTLHTTVGIMKMNPEFTPKLYSDLLLIAPDKPELYYHNKLVRKGELKRRKDGTMYGDGNGVSHVMAGLLGSYTIAKVENGKIVLEDKERLLHHDMDTQPQRERYVAVTLIAKEEGKVND